MVLVLQKKKRKKGICEIEKLSVLCIKIVNAKKLREKN
jgi:hypothetical protein